MWTGEPNKSKKKEDEWGWGSILGGIAVAGALAVGAGMAIAAYQEEQEKEQKIQHFRGRTQSHQYHSYSSDDDDDSPPPPPRKEIGWYGNDSDSEVSEKPMNKVQVLERIHKQFVSIKDQKEEYVNYFKNVRKYLIPKLREKSQAFQMLTNGEAMTGNV